MNTKYYRNNLRFTAVFLSSDFIEVCKLQGLWKVTHGRNALLVQDSISNDKKSTKEEFEAALRQAQEELSHFLQFVSIENKETPTIMNFRDLAKMNDLVDGDRFHLAGDASKNKLVLMSMTSRKTVGGYSYTAVTRNADVQANPLVDEQAKYNTERTFKKAENIKVVFLRHKEAIA